LPCCFIGESESRPLMISRRHSSAVVWRCRTRGSRCRSGVRDGGIEPAGGNSEQGSGSTGRIPELCSLSGGCRRPVPRLLGGGRTSRVIVLDSECDGVAAVSHQIQFHSIVPMEDDLRHNDTGLNFRKIDVVLVHHRFGT